jgi:hypothetical protein
MKRIMIINKVCHDNCNDSKNLVGHTVRLSLAARINRRRRRHRRRRQSFTLILGSARVQNGHQTGTQRELKNPTPTITFF